MIGTPCTFAPERPIRLGLDSGYTVVSSNFAMASPPESMVRYLYAGVSFAINLFAVDLFVVVLCVGETCSPTTR